MLIGLTGRMCAGKDTAAAYLAEYHGFETTAFANALKNLTRYAVAKLAGEAIDPWKDKPANVRAMLQLVGQGFRAYDPDFWINIVVSRYYTYDRNSPDLVITDVRYENECTAIHRAGGAVVRIETPDTIRRVRHERLYGPVNEETWNAESERDVLNLPADYVALGERCAAMRQGLNFVVATETRRLHGFA